MWQSDFADIEALRGRLDPSIEGGKIDLSESVADNICSIFLSGSHSRKEAGQEVLSKAMIGKPIRKEEYQSRSTIKKKKQSFRRSKWSLFDEE